MHEKDDFVPGQLLVMFDFSMDQDKQKEILASYNLPILNHLERFAMYLVAVPKGKEREWIAKLSNKPDITFAAVNSYAHISGIIDK